MRAPVLTLLLVAPLLAGCLGDDAADPAADVLPALDATAIVPPSGARLVSTALGVALEWTLVPLPFETTITIPEGATLVRASATVAEEVAVRTSMANQDTGRRRCNGDVLDAWNLAAARGTHTCSGTALIDPPGTNWTVRATGDAPLAHLVRIDFERAPLDGPVAALDLSQLSMPEYEATATTGQYVASFDGTPIWVEVTLPAGDGPWPTVIASSPYNGQTGRLGMPQGQPAMWEYWTHDWTTRGYATVNADVRGFGLSGGCVEVWGENEQKDQAFLVDWVAEQDWSDGRVGFYGQSYVGTTPVAAAVQAPAALKAIIAVAPVINSYEDWHHGGVPNGENLGSPAAYQVLTDMPGQGTGPLEILENSAKGVCDPTLAARANDPRALYDSFYAERDFKQRTDKVQAAVLFTQGFEDSNVKSSMIPGWFNELTSPKLGLFGHWVHQHPTRADEEILFLGWMDQYVKGRALGFEQIGPVEVATNVGTLRTTDVWPPTTATELELWPDYAAEVMATTDLKGPDVHLTLSAAGTAVAEDAWGGAETAGARTDAVAHAALPVTEPFAFGGVAALDLHGTLETPGNAYLAAFLYDAHDGRRDLITYGMWNLAHDETHTTYTPVVGTTHVTLPFLPTEYVFEAGHTLVLEVRGIDAGGDGLTLPSGPGVFTLGDNGQGALRLPLVPLDSYVPLPAHATP